MQKGVCALVKWDIIFITVMIIAFMGFLADTKLGIIAEKQSCKDIGMECKTVGNTRYCEKDLILHIAKFECNGFLFWYD